MAFTEYITKQGDRWDSIALAAYGDSSKINEIVSANFGCPTYPVLPAGIRLQIPIIETSGEEETNKDLLPPWKRVETEGELIAKSAVPVFNEIKSPLLGSFDGSFD